MTRDELYFCLVAAACVAINYIATDIYLPAMPYLREYFGTSTAVIQSTVSIFMLGAVCSQLLVGPIADHYGFKQTAIPLAILLIFGSLVCMFANSIALLQLGRLLQAIGAGGLTVIGRPSFSRRFEPERAARLFILILPSVSLCSPALAPIVGGLLTYYISWRSIFLLTAVLALIILFGIVTKYTIGKQENVNTSIHPIFIIKTYVHILFNRLFLTYINVIFLSFMIYFAFFTEGPFIYHELGYSSKEIGFTYFGVAIVFFITNQLAAHLIKKIKKHTIIHIGFICVTLGLILLFIAINLLPNNAIAIFITSSIFLGCMGLTCPIIMGMAIGLFPQKSGYASSLTGSTAMLGASIGAQSVHVVTQGSLNNFAIAASILIVLAWLPLFLQK